MQASKWHDLACGNCISGGRAKNPQIPNGQIPDESKIQMTKPNTGQFFVLDFCFGFGIWGLGFGISVSSVTSAPAVVIALAADAAESSSTHTSSSSYKA